MKTRCGPASRPMLKTPRPAMSWVCQELQRVDEGPVCGACTAHLLGDARPTCFRCASTVGPHVDTTDGCMRCRDSKLAFDQAFRLGPYEGPLREVVLRMKNRRG